MHCPVFYPRAGQAAVANALMQGLGYEGERVRLLSVRDARDLAELDAAFFHLYGIGRDDVEYILSTFKGIHDQPTLFLGSSSVAQRIVQKYADMSFPA